MPDHDSAPSIRRRNPRLQGEIGVADAIAWFVRAGYRVSLPVQDNQPYDLVVDDGSTGLRSVQVKTTTRRTPYGRFEVQLETRGGNQSFHTSKLFDPSLVNLVYVLTDADERYLIPSRHIDARRTITLGAKWSTFRVDDAAPPVLPEAP